MQPQRKNLRLWALIGIAAVVILMENAISFSQESGTTGGATHTSQKKGRAAQGPSTDLYAAEPEPLTPVQCGQCHTAMYRELKKDGARHRFLCQNCHRNFHSYSPEKKNWRELMPKCSNCHTTPPHGEKYTECSVCHNNPHAIGILSSTEVILNSCPDCHRKPFQQLQQFPSAHSKLLCRYCHTAHGYIPSCTDCHKPHLKGQAAATCIAECHQAHMPREITFRKDADARTCSVCHYDVYTKWSQTPSRHGKVNCAVCHTKHGYIPACRDCHPQPHSQELLAKFSECLTCHQDPHDPPVKRRSK